jgi:hypothetical protein
MTAGVRDVGKGRSILSNTSTRLPAIMYKLKPAGQVLVNKHLAISTKMALIFREARREHVEAAQQMGTMIARCHRFLWTLGF